MKDIIFHLTEIDFLEKIGNEFIIGIEGEKVVNNKDFYSLFKTETFFKVSNKGNKIGELPMSFQIKTGENVFLSAKIWKIMDVDFKSKKIEVIPTNDGKKPLFFGSSADTAHKIREKMLEILFSKGKFEFLDEMGQDCIDDLRKDFSAFKITNSQIERPVLLSNDNLTFYSFASSKINKTLHFILQQNSIESHYSDDSSSFAIKNLNRYFVLIIKQLNLESSNLDKALKELIEKNSGILDFSKWGQFLPIEYQVQLLKNNYFDFEECDSYLKNLKIVIN